MLFFIHVTGAVYDPDTEGFEFATLSEARIEAVRFAASTLRERPEVVWTGEEFRVDITDENQLLLCTFIAFGVDAPAADAIA